MEDSSNRIACKAMENSSEGNFPLMAASEKFPFKPISRGGCEGNGVSALMSIAANFLLALNTNQLQS